MQAGPGTFTVLHYGGSNWRWSVDFRFDYSRADDAWLLARVDEQSFHTGDPRGTGKQYSLVPRLHYGKISIRDFDPEDFVGRGLACSKTAADVAGRWQNARGGPFREISFAMPDQGGAVITRGEDVITQQKTGAGCALGTAGLFHHHPRARREGISGVPVVDTKKQHGGTGSV
jgi:hypothetical protein